MRICGPKYVPTEEDLIRCRVRTTGEDEDSDLWIREFVLVGVLGSDTPFSFSSLPSPPPLPFRSLPTFQVLLKINLSLMTIAS